MNKILIFLVFAVLVCINAQGQHHNPGSCPIVTPRPCPLTRRCQSDSECLSDQKCCNTGCTVTCIRPRDVTESLTKPGTCPTNRPGDAGVCTRFCQNDGACRGSLKCCNTACGGATCMPPVRNTQGRK
ncbi:hypothetical protein B566_EDAN018348 [Ephemera danica]|nr:hypothetical protein B566_EDAN018348 [Ephemera danica]